MYFTGIDLLNLESAPKSPICWFSFVLCPDLPKLKVSTRLKGNDWKSTN